MFEDLTKEQKMMRYFVILTSAFLVLAWTSVAMAVPPPSASGNLSGTQSPVDEYSGTGTGPVDIGGGTGIGIYLDPNAGPWQKLIVGISVSPKTILEGINIMADPNYIPAPGPAWTDWDEQIMTLGWHWANASLVITEPDLSTKNVIGVISTKVNPNDFVVFNFIPAENPGATLAITKNLVFNAGVPVNQNCLIIEYPTPEPATIVLLISGLLAFGLGYIRRRK